MVCVEVTAPGVLPSLRSLLWGEAGMGLGTATREMSTQRSAAATATFHHQTLVAEQREAGERKMMGTGARAMSTATKTFNFKMWCEQNGELGQRMIDEWDNDAHQKAMTDVRKGSAYRAWWKCRVCAHKWAACVKPRTRKTSPTGCPGCAGKVPTSYNNLTLLCRNSGGRLDHLPGEWNHPTNRMEEYTPSSHSIVPWKCRGCGHEFNARINNRTHGERPSGCPACAGSVPTETHNLKVFCDDSGGRLAHLPGEWNHPTNWMEEFTPASNERVPWKCECGGEWNARIGSRTRSERPSGCPACAGSVTTATETHNLKVFCDDSGGRLDHLPGEWNHPTKRMEDFAPFSGEKVPWKCGKCAGEWNAVIQRRSESGRPSGCPACDLRGRREKWREKKAQKLQERALKLLKERNNSAQPSAYSATQRRSTSPRASAAAAAAGPAPAAAAAAAAPGGGDAVPSYFPAGSVVCKHFDGKWFMGKIIEVDEDDPALPYFVKYEDGDEEDMSHEELAKWVIQDPVAAAFLEAAKRAE
jgi:hypothetical protein